MLEKISSTEYIAATFLPALPDIVLAPIYIKYFELEIFICSFSYVAGPNLFPVMLKTAFPFSLLI